MSKQLSEFANLRVNSDRLWARHMEMARIGAIPGDGNCRLAMSDADGAARTLFAGWCRAAGLTLHTDRAGNMFAIRPGRDATLPLVASGSHLDTQPHGGRFDGISGVLAALEVVETLNDAQIETEAPLAVINWTNEEGVRFAPGLMGSAWFCGEMSDDDLAAITDADGTSFAHEALRLGWAGQALPADLALGAFIELHIEQGPRLEAADKQVGIVTSVQGLRWLDVTVTGADAHAGTTPLDLRRDALLAAATMLVRLNAAGRACGQDARVSVGRLTTATNGPSTIVGEARFVIDLRHPDAATLAQLATTSRAICAEMATAAGCTATVSERVSVPPRAFDPGMVDSLEAAAARLGYRHMRIASGALHDACNVAKIAPTAMVFVPCRDGISHNVAEYASPEDLAAGASVLLHGVLAAAGARGD